MVEINWTVLTYFVIGLFALSGFFRGWWKEAITTAFLAFLIILLQQPGIAEKVIEILNSVLAAIWSFLPESWLPIIVRLFEDVFAVSTNGRALQADAGSANTWLIILLALLGLSILIGRMMLPGNVRGSGGYVYAVRPIGSLLGGLLGGLNGFIFINLVREYLDGRNLPASSGPATEISLAGGATVGTASSGVAIQAVELPQVTILDSILPWIIIAVGLLVFLVAINNRVGLQSKDGFRKIEYKAPLGYQRRDY